MPDRRDVDAFLEEMDDVLSDWHGSLDAMVWTAEPPPAPTAVPALDGLRDAFASLGGTLPSLVEYLRSLVVTLELPHPAVRVAPPSRTLACQCLCLRHPDVRCCLGEVLESQARTVRFGAVQVPMCGPCARRPRVFAKVRPLGNFGDAIHELHSASGVSGTEMQKIGDAVRKLAEGVGHD